MKLNYIDGNYKKSAKINIHQEVQESLGIPFLVNEYYAYVLGLSITDFLDLEKERNDSIRNLNAEHLMKIDSTSSIDCFITKNYKRPKIKFFFGRINPSTIEVWLVNVKKNPRHHRTGQYIIFIFDSENRIEKTFETSWIE